MYISVDNLSIANELSSRDPFNARLLRVADIFLGIFLLVFAAPLMALTVLAILMEDSGPVLYKQERVGLNGCSFNILKFRSMRTDAEVHGPVWASQRDSRITFVGRFIRLTHIDELPQVFNILRGEMSFIGPRPERPHFVAKLEKELPLYRYRNLVKPGLTGWAQVMYPYGASVEDAKSKLSYDLYYIKHRSLMLNIKILFATAWVVIMRQGSR